MIQVRFYFSDGSTIAIDFESKVSLKKRLNERWVHREEGGFQTDKVIRYEIISERS